MYVWVGAVLPDEVQLQIQQFCETCNRDLKVREASSSLPRHISVKTSFDTPVYEEVAAYYGRLFSTVRPFAVAVGDIEKINDMIWISFDGNPMLKKIHNTADRQLKKQFGIERHAFDKKFCFHTMLYTDPDAEKISRLYEKVKKLPLEPEIVITKFALGVSETGAPGSYRITRTFHLYT